MTWFRVDDGMLDHPKWKRAIKSGGDAVVHLWLALGTWCSRHLTDGLVPADMLSEIPGPRGKRTRERALQALLEQRLLVQNIDGGVLLHDYLHYNPSRADVLAERDRWARSKRTQRVTEPVHAGHSRDSTWSPGVPSRPPPVPGLSLVGGEPEPELTDQPTHIRIPAAWKVPEALYGEAVAAGVTKTGLDECVLYWRGRKLGGEWYTIEDFFRAKLGDIRKREERERFAAHQGRNDNPRSSGIRPVSDLDTTSAACAYNATSEQRAYAAQHSLNVGDAVARCRGSPRFARLSTIEQEREFYVRLQLWRRTGAFPDPNEPLPRMKPKEARA